MDQRQFPGSPSSAVLLPANGLNEFQNAVSNLTAGIVQDFGVGTGLKATANVNTVQAQGTPNMTVNVSSFDAYGVVNTSLLEAIGLSSYCTGQTGTVVTGDGSSASGVVTIAAASASNPRRDLICWQIQTINVNLYSGNTTAVALKTIDPSTGNVLSPTSVVPNTIYRVALQYVEGTAASSPALPTVPSGWYPLAEIYVAANATSITNSNIFFALPLVNTARSLVNYSSFADQLLCYSISSGLTLNYNAGSILAGNTFYAISAGTLTLTASATNYVFVLAGQVLANITGFQEGCTPLAVVVTGTANISSISDKRTWLRTPFYGAQNYPTAKPPVYTSTTQITLKAGYYTDDTGLVSIYLSADTIVDLSVSGANGLDTGALAANTWYYLYVIYNPTTGVVKGLFTATLGSPTLPANYTISYYTKTAFRTNASSHIKPVKILANSWPRGPEHLYTNYGDGTTDYQLLSAAPTSWTPYDCTPFFPPNSQEGWGQISADSSLANAGTHWRPTGSSLSIRGPSASNNGSDVYNGTYDVRFISSSSQQIDFLSDASTVTITAYIRSYIITES